MSELIGLSLLLANRVMTFMVFALKITPRLPFGMHAEYQDLRARLARTSTVKCLERNMPHSAERRVNKSFAFDGDLRVALEVGVKFLARMPMPIKLAVGGRRLARAYGFHVVGFGKSLLLPVRPNI